MSASLTCSKCKAPLALIDARCRACGADAPSDPLLGRVFNQQYHLKRRLGVGGFGAVYEAEEPRVGRSVAVKVLHPDFTREPILVERFRREGIAASRLEHFSAVKIFNFGETEDGLLYLVMELLPGENLADYLKQRGPIPQEQLLQFLRPVCEVLFEAHQKQLIHRDIKPQNFMLLSGWNQGQVKVLDFGIARMLDAGPLTKTSVVMGTPAYMAPELWDEQRTFDGRADLYALGLVAYHMLSGKFPFEASHISAWVKKHCLEAPIPLSKVVPAGLSLGVEDAVMRALAKDPDERYPDALAMLSAFERALSAHPQPSPTPYAAESKSRRPNPAASSERPPRSKLWLAAPVVALSAAALGLIFNARSTPKKAVIAARPVPLALPTAVASIEWIQPTFPGESLSGVVQTPSNQWLAVGARGLMLRSSDQIKWELLPSLTEKDLNVAWSTQTQVFVAGEAGLLLKSQDSGNTWRQQTLGEQSLSAGFALSESDFVLGDEAGRLFYSKDRGERWTSLQALPTDAQISGIWGSSLSSLFVSATRASGTKGVVYCPTREGAWRECLTEATELRAIFGRGEVVWASVSEKGLKQSLDHGETWTLVNPEDSDSVFQFAEAPNGRICGIGAQLLMCQDKAGEPWRSQLVDEESYGLRRLWLGEDSALAVGRGGQIWAYRAEWRLVTHAFVKHLYDLWSAPSGALFAVVGDNKLWSTKDNGVSWRKTLTANKLTGWTEMRTPSLSKVFEGESALYVSGAPGVVAKALLAENVLYQDEEFGVARISGGLYSKAHQRSLLVSEDGLLYVSKKDSDEWESIDINTKPLFDVHEAKTQTFAVGSDGVILRADHDLMLWEKIGDVDTGYTLRQITSDSGDTLYLAGERFDVVNGARVKSGAILISTDHGEHWKTTLTTEPFLAMQSFAGQVYVLGGGELWVTNNGTSWSPLPIPSQTFFTELKVLPSGELLLGGESGTIAKLTLTTKPQ